MKGKQQMQRKKNARAVLLTVCTVSYLIMGAAVFDLLESGGDMERRAEMEMLRQKMISKYNLTGRDLALLETVVVRSVPHKAGYQWKFAGAFYFATLVITTVGYGHSTPATGYGKAFCMIFALAGIPLGLVMFQSIGERVNTLISYCLDKARKSMGGARLSQISPTHLLIVSLSIGTAVIGLGTYVFHKYENWDIFEAYYYCVMTLSTIGFGDYVALQTENKLQDRPGYVVFTLIFILFGLAIFSACVNLLVLRFMATNTDTTNRDTEPPKTVVLETLEDSTPSNDNHFDDSSRLILNTAPEQRLSTVEDESRSSLICLLCGGRKIRQDKNKTKSSFSVRRQPNAHIAHLLTPIPPDTDTNSSSPSSSTTFFPMQHFASPSNACYRQPSC